MALSRLASVIGLTPTSEMVERLVMSAPKRANSSLRVLVTGGTFDKEYDELSGKLFFRQTHVEEMLKLGRSKLHYEIDIVCMIDSLEMTDEHRKLILKHCADCKEEQILITHGTDTLEITARTLADAKLQKTIVLTGAMIPYKFGSSDGLFNLGSALAYAQALPHGVYVAMNGRCFDAYKVTKNKSTGEFVEIK
jgi:L-asparaginase